MTQDRLSGSVVRLIPERGFGFILDPSSGQEYFFHKSELENCDITTLDVGDAVVFDRQEAAVGPRAKNVVMVEG